jgi:hypothetical protein
MSLTEAEELAILGRFPDVGLPIVLLPVRIETRFMIEAGNAELWVRIYPDEIHVDTHEPGLTDDEARWGRHFWEQTWRAGTGADPGSVERRHRIWEQLAQRFDAERATWIVEALAPTNPGDRPSGTVADDAPIPSPPIHPVPGSRAGPWTRAPVARLLPERFVVLGHRAGVRVMLRAGRAVPPDLNVGPDPLAPPSAVTPHDTLTVDAGMRWLVDFKVAEEIGMAIRVPLTVDDRTLGFDVLLVAGLRTAPAPGDEAVAIEGLITAHRYTEGCAVTAVGTATNNSDLGSSGHSVRRLDPAATYPLDVPDVAADSAAAQLAAGLGIDPHSVAPLVGAGTRQDVEAAAMQTLLWPATGGYFLDQLFSVLPEAPSARAHALANVRAEGPLPPLRVGRQPYGILPVSSLDHWPLLPPNSDPLDFPRPNVVIPLLKGLRDRWRSVTPQVPRIDRRADGSAATEATILAVMRGAPTSAGYDMRLVFDDALFGVPGLHSQIQLPPQAMQRTASTQGVLRGLGVLGDARLLHTVAAATSAHVRSDAMVAPADAPQGDAELLAWLRDSAPEVIVAEQGLAAPPGHLLYLIARHAVLLTYASVATQIQQAGGDTEPATEPAIVDVTEPATVTLGRRIARPLPGLSKPLHALTATDHPAAAALDDMRAALDRLAALGPERLSMLLAGTLDVFAYRLDAWLTSLATRRLTELRAAAPSGSVVGAFGWLEDVRPRAPLPAAPALPDEPGPLVVDPLSAGFVHAPSLPQAATAAVLRAGYVAVGPAGADGTASSPFAVDLSSQRVRLADWLLEGVRQGQELGALLGQRFERGLHDRGLDRYIAPFRRIAPFGEIAVAEAEAADAAADLARLRAGNPDLPAARAALTAAQAAQAQLVREQADLLGRMRRAQDALPDVSRRLREADADVLRFGELVEDKGSKPGHERQLAAAQAQANELKTQVLSLQADITAAGQRLAVIGGLVTNAARAVGEAQARVDNASVPLPGVDAAIERDAKAKIEFERVVAEYRRRRLYPPTATIESLEALEAVHLIDGLALARLSEQGGVPFGTKGLPPAGATDHGPLQAELAGLDAALDAVADALTAESVHQLVQGNPHRAGASLDSVAQRNVPPPELAFARTPRTGVAITHRVLAVVPESGESWPMDDRQVRATAEPALDRWAAAVLGDPGQIRCDVRYLDAAGELLVTRDLRMASGGLGALDVLAMVDGSAEPRPELTAYLVDRALATKPDGVPDGAGVELVLDRHPDWPAEVRSFSEVFEVARAVNELVATARPVSARDLAPAGSRSGAVDLAELAERVDALELRIGVDHDTLVGALDGGDPTALRSAVSQMLYIGVPGSVLTASVGDDAASLDELRSRGAGIAADVGRRLAAAHALVAAFPATGLPEEDTCDHQVARIHALLGSGFTVLPQVVLAADDPLAAALGDGPGRFGGDRGAPSAWLHRVGDVRRGVERLQTVMLYAAGGPGSLGVAQLPFTAGERWVALPSDTGTEVPGGRTSIVVHAPGQAAVPGRFAGLFVDEWVEVVPNAQEITGVACNIDEPAAQPPQAVLIAVAPPQSKRWGLDLLESILLETLDLARLRAVSPEQLASFTDLEQVLPALYFGLNLHGDTVSTDFTRAVRL